MTTISKAQIVEVLSASVTVRDAADTLGLSKSHLVSRCKTHDIKPGTLTTGRSSGPGRKRTPVPFKTRFTMIEIIDALTSSYVVGEAARQLGCSDATVRNHCTNYDMKRPSHYLRKDAPDFVPWPKWRGSFDYLWAKAFGKKVRYRDHPGAGGGAVIHVSRNSSYDVRYGAASMRSISV